jgi:hypothetical protein
LQLLGGFLFGLKIDDIAFAIGFPALAAARSPHGFYAGSIGDNVCVLTESFR